MTRRVAAFPDLPFRRRHGCSNSSGAGAGLTIRAPIAISGRIGQEEAQEALIRLLAHHESLRTTFSDVDGRLVQRVHAREDVRVPLEFLDLRKA